MPLTTQYVAELDATVITAHGELTFADLLTFIRTDWVNAVHPIVFDATHASAAPLAADDVHRLADTASTSARHGSVRAKLAIAVGTDIDFGMARMFQSLVDANAAKVRVFRGLGEATKWVSNPS